MLIFLFYPYPKFGYALDWSPLVEGISSKEYANIFYMPKLGSLTPAKNPSSLTANEIMGYTQAYCPGQCPIGFNNIGNGNTMTTWATPLAAYGPSASTVWARIFSPSSLPQWGPIQQLTESFEEDVFRGGIEFFDIGGGYILARYLNIGSYHDFLGMPKKEHSIILDPHTLQWGNRTVMQSYNYDLTTSYRRGGSEILFISQEFTTFPSWSISWQKRSLSLESINIGRSMDFEDGVDKQVIRSRIPGLEFSTTQGYDWVYGDWRTGQYSGPYPKGSYFSNGNFFAWLGPNQGAGRIDLAGATASYLSIWTSTYSGVTMDAYDAQNNLLANSGWASNNLNTGRMTKLTVTAPNIAYVVIHDTGNYWLIDDLEVSDLLAKTKIFMPKDFTSNENEYVETINAGGSIQKSFLNSTSQPIELILGWAGSEFGVQVYRPDATLYGEYQSGKPPIIIDIPNAIQGEWRFVINAIDIPHNEYPFAFIIGLPDFDKDGIADTKDNCPNGFNPDQIDNNGNGIGDVCENNHEPVANAGPDQSAPVKTDGMTAVTLDGSDSYDSDGDQITYSWSWNDGAAIGENPIILLPFGKNLVRLVVNDGIANSEDTVMIEVVDTTPPSINSVAVSPNTLWPPNHKMVSAQVTVSVSDNLDPNPSCKITSISSSEPVNGIGDGDTAPDWEITGDLTAKLRAERSGTDTKRVYTMNGECKDAAGNSAPWSTTVTVPHD